jgi:hypothetical protein
MQLEGPPVITVVSTSGEADIELLVAGIPLNVAVSVETVGEIVCQRHQLEFAGSKIIGYSANDDELCGDESVDIDWGAIISAVIKVVIKTL